MWFVVFVVARSQTKSCEVSIKMGSFFTLDVCYKTEMTEILI